MGTKRAMGSQGSFGLMVEVAAAPASSFNKVALAVAGAWLGFAVSPTLANPAVPASQIAPGSRAAVNPLRGMVFPVNPLAIAAPAATPQGGTVVNGNATFNQQGNRLIVTNTPGTIINWQSFNIGQGATTVFNQQSAQSAVLNRVTGQDPSSILGTLSSNGRVFLINPNGVVFGQGSIVDTAGLVASTLDLSNDDFRAGRMRFVGSGASGDVNVAGVIKASSGDVYLIAPNVTNTGLIQAPNGTVALAAGQKVEIASRSLDGISFEVQAPENKAVNLGAIEAGAVGMFAGTLQHSGAISATQIDRSGGIVMLKAGGTASVAGSVNADGAGAGGKVTITGQEVTLASGSVVSATGSTVGGTINLGGGRRGQDAAIANANTLTVQAGAIVDASGVGSGSGGTVIAYSKNNTNVQGVLAARGGAGGGNGGFVETSGATLATGKFPDVSAASGRNGEWLIDPDYIEIAGGPGNGQLANYGGNIGPNTPVGSPFLIGENEIETFNGNVTLVANHGVRATGTFYGGLAMSGANALTMETVNAGPAPTGVLYSNDSTATAGIDLTATGGISTGTGALTVRTNTSGGFYGASITLPTINAGGNVTISGGASGGVTVNNIVAGGALDLNTGGGVLAANSGTKGGTTWQAAGNLTILSGLEGGVTVLAQAPTPGAAGNGGLLSVRSTGGNVDVSGASIFAQGDSSFQSPGLGGTGGSVSIRADAGTLRMASGVFANGGSTSLAGSAGGAGGTVDLFGANGVDMTGDVYASGGSGTGIYGGAIRGGAGGTITVRSTNSAIVLANNVLNVSGGDGSGNAFAAATGPGNAGAAGGNGGSVIINSGTGAVTLQGPSAPVSEGTNLYGIVAEGGRGSSGQAGGLSTTVNAGRGFDGSAGGTGGAGGQGGGVSITSGSFSMSGQASLQSNGGLGGGGGSGAVGQNGTASITGGGNGGAGGSGGNGGAAGSVGITASSGGTAVLGQVTANANGGTSGTGGLGGTGGVAYGGGLAGASALGGAGGAGGAGGSIAVQADTAAAARLLLQVNGGSSVFGGNTILGQSAAQGGGAAGGNLNLTLLAPGATLTLQRTSRLFALGGAVGGAFSGPSNSSTPIIPGGVGGTIRIAADNVILGGSIYADGGLGLSPGSPGSNLPDLLRSAAPGTVSIINTNSTLSAAATATGGSIKFAADGVLLSTLSYASVGRPSTAIAPGSNIGAVNLVAGGGGISQAADSTMVIAAPRVNVSTLGAGNADLLRGTNRIGSFGGNVGGAATLVTTPVAWRGADDNVYLAGLTAGSDIKVATRNGAYGGIALAGATRSTSGSVILRADRINLTGGTLTASAGAVDIGSSNAGQDAATLFGAGYNPTGAVFISNVVQGGAAGPQDGIDGVVLNQNDLAAITASRLILRGTSVQVAGDAAAGPAVAPVSAGTLVLESQGNISQQVALRAGNVIARSGSGQVTLDNAANDVAGIAGAAYGGFLFAGAHAGTTTVGVADPLAPASILGISASGPVSIRNTGGQTTVTGAVNSGGALSFTNTAGNLQIQNSVTSASNIVLDTGTAFDVNVFGSNAAGTVLSASNGTLGVTGNNVTIAGAGGPLTVSSLATNIRANGTVTLGQVNAAASTRVLATNSLNLNAANLVVQGGSGINAFTLLDPPAMTLNVSGNISVLGGTGNGAYARIEGTTVAIPAAAGTDTVSIRGGAGNGAYGAIVGSGVQLAAATLEFVTGTGTDAKAVLIDNADVSTNAISVTNCIGCGDVASNALSGSAGGQRGLFPGLQIAGVADTVNVPDNRVGTSVNLIANDRVGGAPAVVTGPAQNAVFRPGTLPAGFTVGADGRLSVAVGTAPGTYNLSYNLCRINSVACSPVALTVTVTALAPPPPPPPPPIVPLPILIFGVVPQVLNNQEQGDAAIENGRKTPGEGSSPSETIDACPV